MQSLKQNNLRGCSVGVTDGWDLCTRSMPLRWPQVAWYTYSVSTILEVTLLVLLVVGMCEVHRWNGLRWHNTHAKFHDNQLRHSSNINFITSTILEATVLLLLMGGIKKYAWYRLYTKFNDDPFSHSSTIIVITATTWEAALLVLLMATEMAPSDMTHILNFMNICSGVQKLLGGMHIQTHIYQGNLITSKTWKAY
jgi:hypothetical protein